jgi:hypothetical protein
MIYLASCDFELGYIIHIFYVNTHEFYCIRKWQSGFAPIERAIMRKTKHVNGIEYDWNAEMVCDIPTDIDIVPEAKLSWGFLEELKFNKSINKLI